MQFCCCRCYFRLSNPTNGLYFCYLVEIEYLRARVFDWAAPTNRTQLSEKARTTIKQAQMNGRNYYVARVCSMYK